MAPRALDTDHAATNSSGPKIGGRPVRIANCSGSKADPGQLMLRQATEGPVDAITGDYLAEFNLAENAEAMASQGHPGYEQTALDGISLSLKAINDKGIKIVVNGGALNPKGLAEAVVKLVNQNGYNLRVAYVEGDNLMQGIRDRLKSGKRVRHLDSETAGIVLNITTASVGQDWSSRHIVSANAYTGARAIKKGLDEGADIIICGRVADASPVIGTAWWWHGWLDSDFDQLAAALVAGHLIECSTYLTGSNLCNFFQYQQEDLCFVGPPIAEVAEDGTIIVTKHESFKGYVTEDTVRCQLLYELQGNIYLNSDVTADLASVSVMQVGENRVQVTGVKGSPPPPTTKFAIYYRGGWQLEYSTYATGYATRQKFELEEKQLTTALQERGILDKIALIDFQRIGSPIPNPRSQLQSTSALRIFVQADEQKTLLRYLGTVRDLGMQHFSGKHGSLDSRTMIPKPFLAYYPALIEQDEISESVIIIGKNGNQKFEAGHPPQYAATKPRENYDTMNPVSLTSFGPTKTVPLGDVVLGRSGDKGANINLGLFVKADDEYEWLRTLASRSKLKEWMGEDWKDEYFIERVEFPKLRAVHFVVYGPLSRGVTSCPMLDCFGKGFADYIRSRHVDVPERFLAGKTIA